MQFVEWVVYYVLLVFAGTLHKGVIVSQQIISPQGTMVCEECILYCTLGENNPNTVIREGGRRLCDDQRQ